MDIQIKSWRLIIPYLYDKNYLVILHCLLIVQDFSWRIFCAGLWSRSTKKKKLNVVTYIPYGEYRKISSQELLCTLCNFLRYLSKELACASLIIETVTIGGDMWTWSLVPTSRRTVAEKRVLVFKTYVNEINLKEFFTLHEIVDFISIFIMLIRW